MDDSIISYRPIRRLLIANRGEIAVRIHETAKKMGITTIGIITDAEFQTPADEYIFIEGSSIAETYLNTEAIINAALSKKVDAIHPGYGFLSENSTFAKACRQSEIIFVGPTEEVIHTMGDKTNARLLAQSLHIPVIKGLFGTKEEIYNQKQDLSFPLLIKSAAGGGGKGMILVTSSNELQAKLKRAEREAERYFGDKTLLAEQLIDQPKHIEVQILADQYGNCIHLYERECSIQRRYQKIIEEAPSPFVTEELREKLTSDALKLCKSIGYQNAGTVEFLVDQNGNHFFLEVNTRLQVEHPVTEMITSIDLVEQQLLIAMGLPLSLKQNAITINGHAVECRIYAEDPHNNFQPAPGKVLDVSWPEESIARTDSWFRQPIEVRADFDPMLAKIITHGSTRIYAIEKMKKALNSTTLIGNINNIWYLKSILESNEFKSGNINSNFCEVFKPNIPKKPSLEFLAAATLIWQLNIKSNDNNVWGNVGFFRFNQQVNCLIENRRIEIKYKKEHGSLRFFWKDEIPITISDYSIRENSITFSLKNKKVEFKWAVNSNNELILEKEAYTWKVIPHYQLPKSSVHKKTNNSKDIDFEIKAPIPGKIVEINTQVGEQKKEGDTLMVLEAMKMENHIQMPRDGVIKKILIETGKQVKANEMLVEIENIKE